jgi:hypothetical protein
MYVTDPACPACGHRGANLDKQLAVLGYATVAGAMLKLSATDVLVWTCESCGANGRAHPPPGFVFVEDATQEDDKDTAPLPAETGRQVGW